MIDYKQAHISLKECFRHRVSLGIALYQKYTGKGIGRVMLETAISLAKEMGYEHKMVKNLQ